MNFYEHIAVTNFALTWFMVGLIWLIQIVNYPLFRFVEKKDFVNYHKSHVKRITPIVSSIMTLEACIAVLLLMIPTSDANKGLALINLLFLAGIWLSTALLQLPMHNKLNILNNSRTINQLIISNWSRTVLWSLKGFWGWVILT